LVFKTVVPRNRVVPLVVTVVTFVPRSASRLTAILGLFEQPPAKAIASTAILMLMIGFIRIECEFRREVLGFVIPANAFVQSFPSRSRWDWPARIASAAK
jgi:hypothetical protein